MDKLSRLHFTTPRLIIRPLAKNDYEAWLKGFKDRLPAQYKHDKGQLDMSDATVTWFYDLVERQTMSAEQDDLYIWGIFDRNNNHLGMLDIKTLSRDNFQWAEIGYFMHNQYWRNDYCYEAVAELVFQAYETLKFHRIEAHVNIDNKPSIKLLEKVGFKFECLREGFIYEDGKWTDNYVYYINTHNNDLHGEA